MLNRSTPDNCLLNGRCFCTCLVCVGNKDDSSAHCVQHRYGCHYGCRFLGGTGE